MCFSHVNAEYFVIQFCRYLYIMLIYRIKSINQSIYSLMLTWVLATLKLHEYEMNYLKGDEKHFPLDSYQRICVAGGETQSKTV